MKIKELKSKTVAEMDILLREHARTLLNMRLARKGGQVEKPHLFRELRREVARIHTLLRQKKA